MNWRLRTIEIIITPFGSLNNRINSRLSTFINGRSETTLNNSIPFGINSSFNNVNVKEMLSLNYRYHKPKRITINQKSTLNSLRKLLSREMITILFLTWNLQRSLCQATPDWHTDWINIVKSLAANSSPYLGSWKYPAYHKVYFESWQNLGHSYRRSKANIFTN